MDLAFCESEATKYGLDRVIFKLDPFSLNLPRLIQIPPRDTEPQNFVIGHRENRLGRAFPSSFLLKYPHLIVVSRAYHHLEGMPNFQRLVKAKIPVLSEMNKTPIFLMVGTEDREFDYEYRVIERLCEDLGIEYKRFSFGKALEQLFADMSERVFRKAPRAKLVKFIADRLK